MNPGVDIVLVFDNGAFAVGTPDVNIGKILLVAPDEKDCAQCWGFEFTVVDHDGSWLIYLEAS